VAGRRGRPHDDDCRFFSDHGYWVAPVLFTSAEVDRFREAMDRVRAGEHRTGRAPALDLPIPADDTALRKIDNAWWADPDLAALATDARLGAVAARLLGVERIRLWQDQLLHKPPSGEARTRIGWHQDWDSWRTVASIDRFVTAWVALDDVDAANGAMQVLPGSNHWGLLRGQSNFLGTDLDAQLEQLAEQHDVAPHLLELEAGQVSFHHVLTFHGSSTNTSNRVRRSLAVHLVDATVASVSHLDGWQHYNLGLLQQRGGEVGDAYDIDDLWPVVFPPPTNR
jgi:ectoine hydroxylase-related dioxygenase (phytanoyl-CoA dioxygenase family)